MSDIDFKVGDVVRFIYTYSHAAEGDEGKIVDITEEWNDDEDLEDVLTIKLISSNKSSPGTLEFISWYDAQETLEVIDEKIYIKGNVLEGIESNYILKVGNK